MYLISISKHAPLLSYASLQVSVRIVKAEIPRELCLVEYLAAAIQALLLSLYIDDVVPDLWKRLFWLFERRLLLSLLHIIFYCVFLIM